MSAESIALYIVAVVVVTLAMADLAGVGLVWAAVVMVLGVLAFANFPIFVVALLVLAAVVASRMRERLGSGSASPPNPT